MSDKMVTFTISGKVKFANVLTPKSYDSGVNKFVEDNVKGKYVAHIIVDDNSEKNKKTLDALGIYCDQLVAEFRESERYKNNKKRFVVNPMHLTMCDDGTELITKRNCRNKAGKEANIKLYDKYRNKLDLNSDLGRDSRVVLNFCVYSSQVEGVEKVDKKTVGVLNYYTSFCLLAVQVLDHKEPGGNVDWMDASDELVGEEEIVF